MGEGASPSGLYAVHSHRKHEPGMGHHRDGVLRLKATVEHDTRGNPGARWGRLLPQ